MEWSLLQCRTKDTDRHKTVHDLDALTGAEVEQLVRDNPDGVCGTFVSADKGVFRLPSSEAPSVRLTAAAAVFAAVPMACGYS
jgi:hypothetical protein